MASDTILHPRNPHRGRYDFTALCDTCPALTGHLRANPSGDQTIDFCDDRAVLCLNRALLAHYYDIKQWQIPAGYLCPPIPGRADYIHSLADLLAVCYRGNIPRGRQIKVLDIGTGANCIYPIIGNRSYGWQFVATEIDPVATKAARLIVKSNPPIAQQIKVVQQKNSAAIFKGIIEEGDRFDLTLCNPPFHASLAEAQASHQRKTHNLNRSRPSQKTSPLFVKPNFGGQQRELWTPGGEIRFLKQMAKESATMAQRVCWFSSLVSKNENVWPLKKRLNQLGAQQVEVIKMRQGQKISRLVAWSFLTTDQQSAWAHRFWQ